MRIKQIKIFKDSNSDIINKWLSENWEIEDVEITTTSIILPSGPISREKPYHTNVVIKYTIENPNDAAKVLRANLESELEARNRWHLCKDELPKSGQKVVLLINRKYKDNFMVDDIYYEEINLGTSAYGFESAINQLSDTDIIISWRLGSLKEERR